MISNRPVDADPTNPIMSAYIIVVEGIGQPNMYYRLSVRCPPPLFFFLKKKTKKREEETAGQLWAQTSTADRDEKTTPPKLTMDTGATKLSTFIAGPTETEV